MAEVPDRLPPVDVVVVGLGAAGGIVANRLAQQGLRVAGLEAGPRVAREEFVFDEIANDIRNVLGDPKINGEVPTRRPRRTSSRRRAGRGAVSPMSTAGGGSIDYRGRTPLRPRGISAARARATPVTARSRCGRFDRHRLADRPRRPAPDYDAVEEEIGVSGRGGENVFEGPRTRLPALAAPPHGLDELVAEAARRRGLHPFAGPAAIRLRPTAGSPPAPTAASATSTAATPTRRAPRTST